MAEEKKTTKPDKPKLQAAQEPKTEPTEEQIEVTEERDRYAVLSALNDSEGGKILVEGLKNDIVAVINKITSEYTTMKHDQLVFACVELKGKRELLLTLTNATANKDVYDEQLKELVDK